MKKQSDTCLLVSVHLKNKSWDQFQNTIGWNDRCDYNVSVTLSAGMRVKKNNKTFVRPHTQNTHLVFDVSCPVSQYGHHMATHTPFSLSQRQMHTPASAHTCMDTHIHTLSLSLSLRDKCTQLHVHTCSCIHKHTHTYYTLKHQHETHTCTQTKFHAQTTRYQSKANRTDALIQCSIYWKHPHPPIL